MKVRQPRKGKQRASGHMTDAFPGFSFQCGEIAVLDYPTEFIRQQINMSDRQVLVTEGMDYSGQRVEWHHHCLLLGALGGVIVKSINTLASHQISTVLFEGDGRCSFIKQTKQ
ncbi:SAFB-like transcription modulator [Dissostichus eleginoides]|uniref:SAFB-like transcription modulator n=1 Tax=Dissostichus eleginoides TaxID=100907 RepID=A0AAD9BR36_DISEL|nr:SAFB-like transcription modulator [Dissostichus eleginoides]